MNIPLPEKTGQRMYVRFVGGSQHNKHLCVSLAPVWHVPIKEKPNYFATHREYAFAYETYHLIGVIWAGVRYLEYHIEKNPAIIDYDQIVAAAASRLELREHDVLQQLRLSVGV